MTAGPWGLGTATEIMRFRQASNLSRHRRLALHEQRGALLSALEALDDEARQLAERRRHVVGELHGVRDLLYPVVKGCHGRRPPVHDQPPVPVAVRNAIPVGGRMLRKLCLAILLERGPLSLSDLHTAIHLAGYLLSSRRPVQALSDALRYEVTRRNAYRLERGRYGVDGWEPTWQPVPGFGRPPVDPDLVIDPEDWSGVELEPVDVGLAPLESDPLVEPVGDFARRPRGEVDRPAAGEAGHIEGGLGEGSADSPATEGFVDDDVLDQPAHRSGDAEDDEGEGADDLLADACDQQRAVRLLDDCRQLVGCGRRRRGGQLRDHPGECSDEIGRDARRRIDRHVGVDHSAGLYCRVCDHTASAAGLRQLDHRALDQVDGRHRRRRASCQRPRVIPP